MYVNSATFTEVLCKYVHFPKRYRRKQGVAFLLKHGVSYKAQINKTVFN